MNPITETFPVNTNHALTLKWISSNKPDIHSSEKITALFLEKAIIAGSPEFILKTQRIIKKASQLATGITVLQHLLHSGNEIKITESTESCFVPQEGLFFCFEKCKSYVVTQKNEDPALTKLPNTIVFLHESIHSCHFESDPTGYRARYLAKACRKEYGNQEEEVTITGNQHLPNAQVKNFLSENTALIEMGFGCRINHSGLVLNKRSSPSLLNLIYCRALGSIKEKINANQFLIEKNENLPSPWDQTPVDFLMCKIILETNPVIKKEMLAIAHLLIDSGFKSESALRLAIADNSVETVSKLIASGSIVSADILDEFLINVHTLSPNLANFLEKAGHLQNPAQKKMSLDLNERNIHKKEIIKFGKKLDTFVETIDKRFKFFPETSPEMFQLLISAGATITKEQYAHFLITSKLKGIDLIIKLGIHSPTAILEDAMKQEGGCSPKLFEFLVEKGARS